MQRAILQEARKHLLELHQLRSYQLHQALNLGHLLNAIDDSLQEHDDVRSTLDISSTVYVQVQKNLCTLASWAKGMKQDLEMTQKTTDSCLSTVGRPPLASINNRALTCMVLAFPAPQHEKQPVCRGKHKIPRKDDRTQQ
jgi:hypothetical protein